VDVHADSEMGCGNLLDVDIGAVHGLIPSKSKQSFKKAWKNILMRNKKNNCIRIHPKTLALLQNGFVIQVKQWTLLIDAMARCEGGVCKLGSRPVECQPLWVLLLLGKW
jgi:hypothetical protein